MRKICLVLALGAAAAFTALPAGAQECRDVTHQAGTDCIPLNPQRIAVLDPLTALPTLLSLGAPVVGSAQVYPGDDGYPAYIDPADVAGIASYGGMRDLSLEAVLASDPDLIIGDIGNMGDQIDALRAIAPLLVTRYTYYQADWLTEIRAIAEAVNRSAEAEAQIAALEARAAALRARFAAEERTPLLSRVDIHQGAPLYYRFNCTWFGALLHSAGVDQPESQRGACTDGDTSTVFQMVSIEEIATYLDGDAIALYQQRGTDPLALTAGWPTWAMLDVARRGAVHVVGDAWGVGASIPAGLMILEDLDTMIFPAP